MRSFALIGSSTRIVVSAIVARMSAMSSGCS